MELPRLFASLPVCAFDLLSVYLLWLLALQFALLLSPSTSHFFQHGIGWPFGAKYRLIQAAGINREIKGS